MAIDPVSASAALLRLEGLSVTLPGGRPLLRDLDLTVAPGEVVAILGGSGSGKSTLGRVLFEPGTLHREGFRVSSTHLTVAPAALVPQHGAPLDHLDVPGNVRLALRFRTDGGGGTAATWLERVGLPGLVTAPGTATGALSGGQTQRLAVARALAAGRQLLFLDEPSAGLDPEASAALGRLLRDEARTTGVGIVVVTHDTLLVAEAASRCLRLDEGTGRLVPLPLDPGDREGLETRLRKALARPQEALTREAHRGRGAGPRLSEAWARTLAPLEVPGRALAEGFRVRRRQLPELARVAGRVLRQGLLRPAPFYAVVSILLGFTVLYILVRAAPTGFSATRLLDMVGGSYVLALAPPLSALLFVATSGSAVNAWLGSLALGRQTTALKALGIRTETYLWLPGFLALSVAFWVTALLIAGGMLVGGAVVHLLQAGRHLGPVLAHLAGDLIDPVPERATLRNRALWLILLYGPGIAADVVHRGTDLKRRADDVTRAMTGSVVACTLWVVALELGSALILFATRGAG